jgi:HEAT repeat protein
MHSEVEQLASVLVDSPARSVSEVVRRCRAADALAALGPTAASAIPMLLRMLTVPVQVDCGLALRVAAAAALWKIGRQSSVAMPFLAWALKDEYWGVVGRAVEILAEIGHAAVVPDLIRLAERRMAHGPFHFEEMSTCVDKADTLPLMANIAIALGHCARGEWSGPSYLSEARTALIKLSTVDDDRVRNAAFSAISELENESVW